MQEIGQYQYEIRQNKTDVRNDYLERRAALPAEERAVLDEKICRNLLSTVSYRFADTVLMFYPVRGEIDLRPVMRAALAAGKQVAFPRTNPEDRTMDFYFVTSEADFENGNYGIPEPKSEALFDPATSLDRHVLCLVPGVVFDKSGYRIGYGGGYYDRFLGRCRASTLGVAYHSFIIPNVPHGRFDVSVDVIVSERGVYAKK